MQSQDKNLLINSMEKLISHISQSKSNQEEIYDSLTKNDLKKIIQNLNETNPKLRKVSLTLLSLLLYQNVHLKIRFCQLLNIPLIPGKICINSKISKNLELSQQNKFQLIHFLKEPVKKQQFHFVIWIINMRKNPLTIDFISYSTLKHIDPLDHLVGFILQSFPKSEKAKQSIFQKINVSYINNQRIKQISKQKYIPLYTQRPKSYQHELVQNNKKVVKKSIKQSIKPISSREPNHIFSKFLQLQSVKSQKGSPKKYDLIFQRNRKNTQVQIQKKENIQKDKNHSYNQGNNVATIFQNTGYQQRYSLNPAVNQPNSKNQNNNSFCYAHDSKHKGIQITAKIRQQKQQDNQSKYIAANILYPKNEIKNMNSFKQKIIYKRVTQKEGINSKINQVTNKTINLGGKKQINQSNKAQRHQTFTGNSKQQPKLVGNYLHIK